MKFVLSILLVVVVVGAAGAFGYVEARDTVRSDTTATLESTTGSNAVTVSQWIEEKRQETSRLIADETVQSGSDLTVYETLLAREGQYGPDVLSVHVLNLTTGTVYASTSFNFAGTSLSEVDAPWANPDVYGSLDQQTIRSLDTSYFSNQEDRYVFVTVSRTLEGNRLVVMVSDLGSLMGRFASVQQQETATLINSDGEVVLNVAAADGSQSIDTGDPDAFDSQPPSSFRTQSDAGPQFREGSDRVYAYAPVEAGSESWVFVTSVPKSEAFAVVNAVGRLVGVIVLASLLSLGLVGVVLGRQTVTPLVDLRQKARQLEDGDLDVSLESDRTDEIGQLYAAFDGMRVSLRDRIREAERARKEAEVSRAEAIEMNEYLQEKAEEYSETMRECARGDLTQRLTADGENDAMDRIAEEFNGMVEELEMTTGQLKTFAEEVAEGGREVQDSAEAVREASEQAADSIQRVADDAHDQHERLERIAEEMDAIVGMLEDAAADHPDVDLEAAIDRIDDIGSTIDEATRLGEETMAESENVAAAAEEQAAELTEVSERADALTQTAEYLGTGLRNFETETEHEFVFQTGVEQPVPEGDARPGAATGEASVHRPDEED